MSEERSDLAPYASYNSNSKGRKHQEIFVDNRLAFERDRDRIIHSVAFRRLEYKTQVFVNHEGDYYRTRLTHSLEVAQIGRGIARNLHLNEDLTEAIALAHDLGHTPFGHAGEDTLNILMKDHGGFNHNKQSFRIVDELEEKYPDFNGLNLTWEVREGLIKHNPPYNLPEDKLEFIPKIAPSLEAQLIDLADEIAYNNHDIDDGIKSGYINLEQLDEVKLWKKTFDQIYNNYKGEEKKRVVYKTISTLINLLIKDISATTLSNIEKYGVKDYRDLRLLETPVVAFSQEMKEQNRELKRFLFENLYRDYRVEKMRLKTEMLISKLFEVFSENITLLPPKYQKKCGFSVKERVVADYIAGMTDRFALDEYKRIFEV